MCLAKKRWQFTLLFLYWAIFLSPFATLASNAILPLAIGKIPFRHSAPHFVHSIQPIEIELQFLAGDRVPKIPRPSFSISPHTRHVANNILPHEFLWLGMGDPSLLIWTLFDLSSLFYQNENVTTRIPLDTPRILWFSYTNSKYTNFTQTLKTPFSDSTTMVLKANN